MRTNEEKKEMVVNVVSSEDHDLKIRDLVRFTGTSKYSALSKTVVLWADNEKSKYIIMHPDGFPTYVDKRLEGIVNPNGNAVVSRGRLIKL